jgi:hypothetical protein
MTLKERWFGDGVDATDVESGERGDVSGFLSDPRAEVREAVDNG